MAGARQAPSGLSAAAQAAFDNLMPSTKRALATPPLGDAPTSGIEVTHGYCYSQPSRFPSLFSRFHVNNLGRFSASGAALAGINRVRTRNAVSLGAERRKR